MERTKLDLWVGIFVVMGLVAFLILALKVGNLGTFNAADSYTLYADFNNIGGLKVRAPVRSAGVVVGRVTDVQLDNRTFEARITMKIDSRYRFPRDTTASILTSGLLGEQYIGLGPGGDPNNLKDGGQIKLTQSAVILENLIGQFLFNKAAEGGGGKGK
jgi:phospholipid/cholesterol/gamma-HCH transport system substrate-binding protein